MKALKPKTILLFLVLMGCMPSTGYADTLQEAIDEALIVPLAALEAQVYYNTTPGAKAAMEKYKAVMKKYKAAKEKVEAAMDEYYAVKTQASFEKYKATSGQFKAAEIEKSSAAEWLAAHALDKAKADAALAAAQAWATAKARQGKKRARHCRATLKPVDDRLKIIEIVKCVQIMDAIADSCSTATEQFRLNKKLQVATLKECVTENITGYSALVRYIVTSKAKDQYTGLIEKCRQEETNTMGVLGYEFIWPCFKGYLDMIDEPLEPAPTEPSPEPAEDSETLPKVKA